MSNLYSHVNPRYVRSIISFDHAIEAMNQEGDKKVGSLPPVATWAWRAYDFRRDMFEFYARDGRVWDAPESFNGKFKCPEIISISELTELGAKLHDELWLIRNDAPSQFNFTRQE